MPLFARYEMLGGVSSLTIAWVGVWAWLVAIVGVAGVVASGFAGGWIGPITVWMQAFAAVVIAAMFVVLGAYMVASLRRDREREAGYSVGRQAAAGLPVVDPRSGRVVKTAQELPLSTLVWRERLRTARTMSDS